jgi:uncharacterized repeat protein (TIGR03803 family)
MSGTRIIHRKNQGGALTLFAAIPGSSPKNSLRIRQFLIMSALAMAMFAGSLAEAQTEALLYTFSGGSDGGNPYASPILDSKGNLYGTTVYGGAYDYGAVFELSPGANGDGQRQSYTVLTSMAKTVVDLIPA